MLSHFVDVFSLHSSRVNQQLYHQQLQGLQVQGPNTSLSRAAQGELKHNQELTKLAKWGQRLNWTKLDHRTQFFDTDLYPEPDKDNAELFPHRGNGDETLGTGTDAYFNPHKSNL